MPTQKKSRKDLEQSLKFLRKEIERIDKLEGRLTKAGDGLHPVSRGFLEQMIERKSEFAALIETVERAIHDLDGAGAKTAQKKK